MDTDLHGQPSSSAPHNATFPRPSEPSTTSAKGWLIPAFSSQELELLRTVPRNQLPADLQQKAKDYRLDSRPDHKPALIE